MDIKNFAWVNFNALEPNQELSLADVLKSSFDDSSLFSQNLKGLNDQHPNISEAYGQITDYSLFFNS